MTGKVLCALALAQAFLPTHAEVFKFEARPIPGAYSLQGLAAFTLYAPGDSPAGNAAGERPFVEYRDVQAHSTDTAKNDAALGDYKSLELGLISEADYYANIEGSPTCTNVDQLFTKDADVKMHTIYFTKAEMQHVEVTKTGTYFLIASNCGNFSSGTISGNVAVKNPFGYVSGTDYHKMVAYGWIFGTFMIMSVVWGILCVMWKSELIAMHAIVGLVLGLGLIESGAWYYHLSSMNQTGIVVDSMVCVLVMLTVLTTYTSYTFILVISQGWRMTEEVLDDCMLCKMGVFGLLWVVATYLREGAMTHRYAYHISTTFMTWTAVPSMLVNLFVFGWIFMSLKKLASTLKERGLEDQLNAITRFNTGLIVAVICGALVSLVQFLDSTGALKLDWKYQFIADGGIPHMIFIGMVGLAMFVWMPSAGSAQLGYSAPTEQGEEDGLWKDGQEPENGGNKIAPDTIGQADEDL